MKDNLNLTNRVLKILISLFGLGLLLISFMPGSSLHKPWVYVATIMLPFVFDIGRRCRINFSGNLEFFYLLFLIPAMVAGNALEVYSKVPVYDKIVHCASGVLSMAIAQEVIRASKLKLSAWFESLFIFSFIALVAVLWECYEFAYDKLFDGHMQTIFDNTPDDTMWDMIVALIGGAVGIVVSRFLVGKARGAGNKIAR